MGKQRSRWTTTVVLMAATAMGALALSACELPATCAASWVGPAGGNFADGANWDTGDVPAPTEHACAPAGTSITVSTPVELGAFDSLGTLTVSSTGRLTTSGNTIVDTLVVRGTIAGGGAIVATRADLRTGTIDGSSSLVAVGPSTSVDGVTVTGTRSLVLNTTTWKGTVRLCGQSSLALRGTVRVAEPAGVTTAGCATTPTPTFAIEPKATLDLGGTLTADVPLTNQGTILGTGTIAGAVTNAGTITPGAATAIGSFTPFTGRIQIDGGYTAQPGALLIIDVNGPTPTTEHDQLVLGADATLSSTGLIVRHGIFFNPVLPSSYDTVVVTGGHTLTGGLPTPFTAFGGGYVTWSRSITGGNTLTLSVASCPSTTNFAGLDLSDIDLHACTLSSVDFTGANLTRANLTNARLNGATFTDAVVEGAHLGFVFQSLFSPGIRSGGLIGTPAALARGYVLTEGFLVGPSANLVDADLSGATIVGADLTLANLTRATLTGVTSSGITFLPQYCDGRCVSTGPTFSSGTGVRNGHLIGPGVNLTDVELVSTDLAGLDLTNVRIGGADLLGSTGPGNASAATMVYDAASPTRCSDGTWTGAAGVTTCTGHGPGW